MELGIVGLGKMGANMAERLSRSAIRVVGFDSQTEAVARVVAKGAVGADSLAAMVSQLAAPRTIWLMVPAGDPVDQTIEALLPYLHADDTLIDGGNSNYKDTIRRADQLTAQSIHYVDVGTSGGVWGLAEGYSLMIGGEQAIVERLRPIFEALAPTAETGWGRVGPSGSGHFTKMIHNGIEYGMMQAFAEGFAIMKQKTEFDLDLGQVAEIWRYGSVVRSWLLDLTAQALQENPDMQGLAAYVPDSGEGRWTVQEAIDLNVPAPIITHSLIARIRSRDAASYGEKLLSAMRNKFGGHAMKKEG
jgi:6-phosphogluconate dehydrogenase